ncbi:hypothetical protein [Nesterenkonia flava]|uniref:Replication protein n=1 Tax=Nesterenkonia flava TaxID=469799 RepID=A0ABU1FRV0_9MICC|nr:hypothetical protein [Nesterenkonia flava]MDR5711381.1 hypothetical protein [Nesterenkonia flava]
MDGVDRTSEATRLYATMLQAHTEGFGEPTEEHKRYLWGLALQVVGRERLRLKYGLMRPGAAVAREFHGRGYAVGHRDRSDEPSWVAVQWESHWLPEDEAERDAVLEQHETEKQAEERRRVELHKRWYGS